MNFLFRKAVPSDAPEIWAILQEGIQLRKEQGSTQWQDGYPNLEAVNNDIACDSGYVLLGDECIVGYVAILVNDEPAYKNIQGKWLTNDDFIVFHRMAIGKQYHGLGIGNILMQEIENQAKNMTISSIKADTNFDNHSMLHLFDRHNYKYCGEVSIRNSPRKAFEKCWEKE